MRLRIGIFAFLMIASLVGLVGQDLGCFEDYLNKAKDYQKEKDYAQALYILYRSSLDCRETTSKLDQKEQKKLEALQKTINDLAEDLKNEIQNERKITRSALENLTLNKKFYDLLGLALAEEENSLYFIDGQEQQYPIAYHEDSLKSGILALDLRKRKLEEIPVKVFDHDELQILLVSGLGLEKIPSEIGELKALHTLDLRNNNLSSLPKEISYLENLKTLALGGNQFAEFPDEVIELEDLQTLDLGGNQLTNLPSEVSTLENLQTLLLHHNKFTDIEDIVQKLSQIPTLTRISIGPKPRP